MSRCLTVGIPITITVYDNQKWIIEEEKLEVLKNKIPAELDKMIDLSLYNHKIVDSGHIFTIKKEAFEDNIHDLIREINELMNSAQLSTLASLFKEFKEKEGGALGYYINNINEFTKKNYPLELITYSKNYKDKMYAGLTFVQNKNDKDRKQEVRSTWDSFEDLLFINNKERLAEFFKVKIEFAEIWADVWTNEASFMELKLLNKFSRKIFKTPLSKAMLFYIDD